MADHEKKLNMTNEDTLNVQSLEQPETNEEDDRDFDFDDEEPLLLGDESHDPKV